MTLITWSVLFLNFTALMQSWDLREKRFTRIDSLSLQANLFHKLIIKRENSELFKVRFDRKMELSVALFLSLLLIHANTQQHQWAIIKKTLHSSNHKSRALNCSLKTALDPFDRAPLSISCGKISKKDKHKQH